MADRKTKARIADAGFCLTGVAKHAIFLCRRLWQRKKNRYR